VIISWGVRSGGCQYDPPVKTTTMSSSGRTKSPCPPQPRAA
jgi:hypothetical protein